MVRNSVFLVVAAICLALYAQAPAVEQPTAAQAPAAQAAPSPQPVQPAALSAVDEKSLGFGSSTADVERLMGKPTRVQPVTGGETWFYGLSNITLMGGKLAGWCKYNKPLPMNIGSARPGAPAVKLGSTAQEIVAALGTPDTVAVFGDRQIWFYGAKNITVRNGKVVPTEVRPPTAIAPKALQPVQKQRTPAPAAGRGSRSRPASGAPARRAR